MATVTISGSKAGSTASLRKPGWVALAVHEAGQAVATFVQWLEVARQRRELERLSDYGLKDLGLSRADVDLELRKPFWQR